jgi:hypothetical protein
VIVKERAKARPGLLRSARMRAAAAKPVQVRAPRGQITRTAVDDRVEQMPGYYLG